MKMNNIVLFICLVVYSQLSLAASYSRNSSASFSWETTSTAVVWDNYGTSYSIDDDKSVVPIGFPFTFGGTTYTSVRIISNGLLHFGVDQSMHEAYWNDSIPVTGSWWSPDYDRYMAPYWDDLNPSAGGIVTYDTLGTAGVDLRFVVTWDHLVKYSPGTGDYSIQIILYEDGRFKFQYNSSDANGSSATIGYEVSNTDYDQYSRNSVSVSIGQAIEYTPIPITYSIAVVDDNYTGTPSSACEQPVGATYFSTISAALTDIQGGGYPNPKIRICPGNYAIGTTTLNNANFNNLVIEGTSTNAADALITNSGNGFYIRSGNAGVKLYNLTITGGTYAVYGRTATAVHLENLIVSSTSNHGIYFRSSDTAYLKDINISNTGGHGIYLRASSAASINDVSINTTTRRGIFSDANSDDTVLNRVSVTNSAEYCIYTRGLRAVMFDLTLSACAQHALYIRGQYSEVDTVDISNISVPATNHYGIYVNGADMVLSNITVDTGSTGIYLGGSADRTDVSNVSLSNQGGDGIHLASGANDNVFDGVTITSPGDDAIEIVGGNRTILKNLGLNSIPASVGNYGIYSNKKVEITNATIDGSYIGAYLTAANSSTISGLTVSGATAQGLSLDATSNATVSFGSFRNNDTGILISNTSQNNRLEFNEVKDNTTLGISLTATGTNSGNTFTENCLSAANPASNINNASGGSNNFFDSATSAGNFYGSTPAGSGYSETCLDTNGDGICDNPYTIPGASGGTDNFPLTTCHIQVVSTEYRMDEDSWNGTLGEVRDSGNNSHHGTALNGATTYSAASLGGGVCRIGYFNNQTTATGQAVNVPYHADLQPSASGYTAMMWLRGNKITQPGTDSTILSNRSTLNAGNGFTLSYNKASRRLNWTVGTRNLQSGSTLGDNTWTHVAVTYRPGSDMAIYINGTLDSSTTTSVPALSSAQTSNSLLVADNGASLPWRGYIDELRTFQKPLVQAQVLYYMNQTRSCAVGTLDHFDISPFTNTGSTCLPTGVTFTAYDSNNNILTSYSGTVNISTSTANGIWSETQNTTPGYNPTGSDNGAYTYTFTSGDGGQKTLYLYNQHAQNLTISIQDSVIPASLSTSGNYSFANNAFVWDESLMGFSNPVAGYNHQFKVSMYRRDTSVTPSNCAIATYYTGNKSLQAYYTADASHPAGANAPAINNGTATVTLPNSLPASNNLSLTFSNGVSNTFNLVTTDVGKYSITLQDSATTPAASGSSSVLTVRPFGLAYVDSAGNAYNPTTLPTQAKFVAAGTGFNSQIKAVQYVSGDGIDTATGLPLDYTQLANNPLTPSFNATVNITASMVNPTLAQGGVSGSFTPATASGFSAGIATITNANYSEVGTIQLNLSASNYLATSGLSVTGQQQLGRFSADHFTIENIVPGTFADKCASNFSYLGQTLAYVTNPTFNIVARNASNAVTTNFDDFSNNGGNNFAVNLDASDITGSYSDAAMPAGITMDNSTTLATLTAPVGDGSNNGSFSAQLVRAIHYVKPATVSYGAGGFSPFVATPVASVSVSEAVDGISATATNVSSSSSGTGNIYHGRLNISSAGGSRYSNLSAPFTLEYYNGTGWAKNTNESATCSAFVAADFNYGGSNTFTITPVTAGVGSVDFSCSLASPCAVEKQVLSSTLTTNFPHLLYDWNRDGTENDDQAYISFGVYAGRKSHVYIRENQ